jgi:formylglycine-generating enzyme required for sulfatase activity
MTTFARGIAIAVVCLGSSACGVTIDFATVGNPGNLANFNGWGAVPETFTISKFETTNTQFAEFLNRVDAAGTNPNGVYTSLMGSDTIGGITFNAAAGSGSKYAVKAGAPDGSPAGTSYATMPVAFVTWFTAARFANWLQNGQQANAASMEDGTYTLANQTSGEIPARQSGAGSRVALPSRDEWYKAAFYNGAGYRLWPCTTNDTPTNTVVDLFRPCAANFGGAATPTVGPINVGSYTNSASSYGLYDMLGNVTEYTDTGGTSADAGKAQVFGGSWATPPEDLHVWNSAAPPVFRSSSAATSQIGFRVAVVQAVPEPSAAAVVAAGVVGLAAWRARRRRGTPPSLTRLGFLVADRTSGESGWIARAAKPWRRLRTCTYGCRQRCSVIRA